MTPANWAAPVETGGRRFQFGTVVLAGALAYLGLARLGLAFATLQESISPVWPAAGFSIALLVLGGRRCWPAIALGAFIANAMTGDIGSAAGIAVGNTLEAVIGQLIFVRMTRIDRNRFPIAQSAAISLAALFAPIASTACGVGSLLAAGSLPLATAGEVALTWWTGNAVGILVVTPLLLALAGANRAALTMGRAAGAVVLLVMGAGLSAAAYLLPGAGAMVALAPALLLGARWVGQLGASLLVFLIAALWFAGTAAGLGPFAEANLNDALINTQILLAAVAVCGLLLAETLGPRPGIIDILFLIGTVATGVTFTTVSLEQGRIDRRHLDNLIESHTADIERHVAVYSDALRGGAGLLAASSKVGHHEWHAYAATLDLVNRYPGVYGLGVVFPVNPAATAAFTDRMRADGAPGFSVRKVAGVAQAQAAFPEQFIVAFSEPQPQNAATTGLDMASEPRRRIAFVNARDQRRPTLTATITLVQTRQPGFLAVMPAFAAPPGEAGDDRLIAWVYAPFDAGLFFRTALGNAHDEFRLRAFDATAASGGNGRMAPMFDSAPGTDFTADRSTIFQFFGHPFLLQWQRSAEFSSNDRGVPAVFAAGLILMLALLSALVATLESQKRRATEIAQQMNAALATSNERFSLAVACSQDGIWDFDPVADRVWMSDRCMEIFGYDAIPDPRAFWRSAILPEDLETSRTQFAEMVSGARDELDLVQRYRHRDGHVIHTRSRARAIRSEAGRLTRIIGVHTDITLAFRLERQMKDAVNVMADGFGLFDADDRLILFNEAFIDEGTRKAIGDPTGSRFEDILRAFVEHDMPQRHDPAFDREGWIRNRMERHRNPPANSIEVEWSGGRWMRVSERRTSDGGYVGVWTDVTEIKRSGQRLHDAVGALADGFAYFDAEDRLVVCNEAFRHSPSLRASPDLAGLTFSEILHDFAQSEPTDIRARENPRGWIAERLTRHRNPTDEPYEQVLTDGRVIRVSERRTADGGIVGIWTDITALRVAERRLKDAIESINDGFVLTDADGRVALVNQEFLRLYPKTAPLMSVGADFFATIRKGAEAGEYPGLENDRAIDEFVAYWSKVFADPAPFRGEGALADGRWTLISHHGTAGGGSVNVYTDITEIKRREADLAGTKARLEGQASELIALAEDLRNARSTAEEASKRKSHFLADMSHELRTPLNGILGFADMIRTEMFGSIGERRYVEYANDIHKSGSHLLQLINDLLDLSKIEANRLQLTIEEISVPDLARATAQLVTPLAEARGVRVVIGQTCPLLHADERQARQILLNLLSNAVKFTPAGGTVTLSARELGEEGVALSVADNGIGMTGAEKAKALERFGQVDNNLVKSIPGTGLGLPLVANIARLHGGDMRLDSEKGVGTTVTVTLPWHEGLMRGA